MHFAVAQPPLAVFRSVSLPAFSFSFNLGAFLLPTNDSLHSVFLLSAAKPFRFANSRFLAGIGLLGGISYAAIGVMQRFAGLEPNRREVELYGALTDAQLKRRMDNLAQPGVEFIDSTHDQSDPFAKN